MSSTHRCATRRTARARWYLVPVHWVVLTLFLLFTMVIDVREAQAQAHADVERVAKCIGLCSNLGMELTSSLGCAACVVKFGIWAHKWWRSGGPYDGGFDCAKANIGC
jgi:hypothetical protein